MTTGSRNTGVSRSAGGGRSSHQTDVKRDWSWGGNSSCRELTKFGCEGEQSQWGGGWREIFVVKTFFKKNEILGPVILSRWEWSGIEGENGDE